MEKLTSGELRARGIVPATVVGLRALALWAGGLEPGEFMLAGQTPFVVDMQDGLFISSFGAQRIPWARRNTRNPSLVWRSWRNGNEARRIASKP